MTRRNINRWSAFPFLVATLLSAPTASGVVVDPKLPVVSSAADPADTVDSSASVTATDDDQTASVAPDAQEVECVAKVIIHEAGGESHDGQVAVAQVIRARMRDRRFGTSACGVIKQRGQFFDVDAYNPSRDTPRWEKAVAIATETLAGTGEDVVPGALFFHAVRSGVPGNRVRIAQIGGHLFYR